MFYWGKFFGALFGFSLGSAFGSGFIGLLFGMFVGHQFDRGVQQFLSKLSSFTFTGGNVHNAQNAFFKTTFLVMGHVAKSDGRISEKEIQIARSVMQQMSLSPDMKRRAINLFTKGKQDNFNLSEALREFHQACHGNYMLLQMFIEIQIKAAHADGALSAKKRQLLQYIIHQLGLHVDINDFDRQYRAEQQYGYRSSSHSYHQHRQKTAYSSLTEAYKVLGVSANASHTEIKKAYRRLMSQHHPDKLVSKGLPEEMIKLATEKTQKIKAAYEQICEARGFN